MSRVSRRRFLATGITSAGLLTGASTRAFAGGGEEPHFVERRWPTNPMNACGCIHTIVVPDIEAAIRFYVDLLGYAVDRRGVLGARRPDIEGAGPAGRAYALIRTNAPPSASVGLLRLLAAPPGAKPNRPRPDATIESPGLGALSLMSRDIAASHERLVAAGFDAVSEPLYYNHLKMVPLPGARYRSRDIHVKTFYAFGPATEMVFFTQVLDIDGRSMRWEYPGLHSPVMGRGLIVVDKWPTRRFYGQVFGLLPDRDATVWGQPSFNRLMGASPDMPMMFGGMGDGFHMEVWEWRHLDPLTTRVYPTSLDRLGYSMTTVVVDELDAVRARVLQAKVPVLGRGALPTLDSEYQDGLYLRGAVGELIEVVGRQAPG